MPRPLHVYVPDGLVHVTIKAVGDDIAFMDAVDCETRLSLVAEMTKRYSVVCHGYCILSTHEHLLIRTPEDDLPEAMRWLNGQYARIFNRRHRRRGHLFGERYRPTHVMTQPHLLEVIRYVFLNPPRAGVCERPEDWPWSSYAALLGLVSPRPFVDVRWVLAQFAEDPLAAVTRIRRFVEDAPARPRLAA